MYRMDPLIINQRLKGYYSILILIKKIDFLVLGSGTGYQENDENNDKTGQNRARDWKEYEKTSSTVWICQILQEISQKRTRERMSDQEAKEIKAEAREIMPQPSTAWSLYWSWMAAETPRVFRAKG
ncbi:hypothetical protein Tco_0532119 [Tanacetum coccineum]